MTPANVMFLAAAGTGERRESQSYTKLVYHRILLQTEGSFYFFSRTFIAFGKKGDSLGNNEILRKICMYSWFFIYTECNIEDYSNMSNVKIKRGIHMCSIGKYWKFASILIDFSKNWIKINQINYSFSHFWSHISECKMIILKAEICAHT